MRKIKFNCKQIYDTGTLYDAKIEEIREIKNEMANISNRIKENWTGDDNHNFLESFNAHIYDLTNIINYLEGNGKIMKDTALNHGKVNEEFFSRIERSDNNEYWA